MANRNWQWPGPLTGDRERTCALAWRDDGLLWTTGAREEDGEDEPDVLQPFEDFRAFGPPESRDYLTVPSTVLEEICAAMELSEPAWQKPVSEAEAEWFAAADKGDCNQLEAMLAKGVSVNALDHQRRNALWRVLHGRAHVLATKWLLDHGADVNQSDRYGQTVLMAAALLRDGERAELYLQHGADKTARDSDGDTAYVIAIAARAHFLICKSLDPRDPGDWPRVIHAAATASNVSWLRGQSAHAERKLDVNVRFGVRPDTPLQVCLQGLKPHPEAVRWFVEHGADLTVVDRLDRSTILHHAARQNFPWLVAPCVHAGVAVDARDAAGHTALSLALEGNERTALVRALLEAGADPALAVPGPAGEENIRAKAVRVNLAWSAFLLEGGERLAQWAGLCCHAEAQAEDGEVFWLEFPAEWCGESREVATTRLAAAAREIAGAKCIVKLLPHAETQMQPWRAPGKKLWAVLPDGKTAAIERFRDQRPAALVSCLEAASAGVRDRLECEWQWPPAIWDRHFQPYVLRLRRDELVWNGHHVELIRSTSQFRVEGPPQPVSDTMPREVTDEVCALLGETRREWEVVSSDDVRRKRVEEWLVVQPKEESPAEIPAPPPHRSGKFCYAKLEIADRFNTPTGNGSDSEWTCWAEFPAEWAHGHRRDLASWLRVGVEQAYEAMNRRIADDPEGGSYRLRHCHASVLSQSEAQKQPWRAKGKMLYLIHDGAAAPVAVESGAPARPVEAMGDPSDPPAPSTT